MSFLRSGRTWERSCLGARKSRVLLQTAPGDCKASRLEEPADLLLIQRPHCTALELALEAASPAEGEVSAPRKWQAKTPAAWALQPGLPGALSHFWPTDLLLSLFKGMIWPKGSKIEGLKKTPRGQRKHLPKNPGIFLLSISDSHQLTSLWGWKPHITLQSRKIPVFLAVKSGAKGAELHQGDISRAWVVVLVVWYLNIVGQNKQVPKNGPCWFSFLQVRPNFIVFWIGF